MNKQNQTHLDRSIRESVPTALDSIGMHEIADKFRGLPEITGTYRIEMARLLLNTILPELQKSGQGLPEILRAGSPEVVKQARVYMAGIVTARAIVEAARVAALRAIHGGQILN